MIAVGLIATVAAALLTSEGPNGSTAPVWEAMAPLPEGEPVAVPGGGGMRLSEAGIRGTEANSSGYRLYRVAAVLTVDATVAARRRVRCETRVPETTTTIARTPNNRAAYPLPSTALEDQPFPKRVSIEFTTSGAELAWIELGDAFGAFANRPGVVVEWESYLPDRQGWEWRLPPLHAGKPLRLGFASIWRTTGTPAARISCRLGKTTVRSAGALRG